MHHLKSKIIPVAAIGLAVAFSLQSFALQTWAPLAWAQDSQQPQTGPAQTAVKPSSTVAFDAQTRALLRHADYDRGARVSEDCAGCHGEKGISDTAEFPSIAGMRAEYIYKQLMDFKTGHRISEVMQPTVEELDQGALADMSVFFSRQKPPERNTAEKMSDELEQLIIFGDPNRLIHACSSCHGTKGQGGQYDFPPLAGQNKDYFIKSMQDFKSGARKNDIYSRMRLIAKALTEKEIQALATYYSRVIPE